LVKENGAIEKKLKKICEYIK